MCYNVGSLHPASWFGGRVGWIGARAPPKGESVHLASEHHVPRSLPELMVVGGGKGGVGKSCFSVNLAVEIARRGWRTVLVDADLSCSNVEAMLGVRAEARLDHYFDPVAPRALSGIVCGTPFENLRLIPGTSGLSDAAHPRFPQKVALMKELKALDADLVILDLDAGAHYNTLDFFLLGEAHSFLVITPERTSIDNAFKFLRAALFRRIERFYDSPEAAVLLKRHETIHDFLEALERAQCLPAATREQIFAEVVHLARSLRPKVVVNKAASPYEARIAFNIFSKYARQLLRIEPEHFGHLEFDNCMSDAINAGTPLVAARPRHAISRCIADMTNRLGYF